MKKMILCSLILATTLFAEKQNVRIDATTGVTNQNINFTGTVQLNSASIGDMNKTTYDPANINQQVIGTTAIQTLTNKTLTSPVINTPTGITKTDVGLSNVSNLKDNLIAIIDPVGTDDINAGYAVGSTWINTVTSKVFTCTDSIATLAVWTQGGTTSPLTTKGDIYVYDTANSRLAIGTDGQVLTADAISTAGMKWATPIHLDTNAIHTNTASEISALTEKVTPVNTDFLVIEDSAVGNAKKKIQIGNLPGVSSSVTSVFGRTGVVASAINDYAWGQIDKTVSSIADITTKSHTLLIDIGTNTHPQIDTHIADATIHYTQASISIPSTQISDFATAVTNHADVSANTTNRHASSLLGTKTLDETAIADAKVIGYNATSGNLEYIASGTGSINNTAWTGANWTSTTVGESEAQLQATLKDVGVRYFDKASSLIASDNNKIVEAYYNASGATFNDVILDSYPWIGAYKFESDYVDVLSGINLTPTGVPTFQTGKNGTALHLTLANSEYVSNTTTAGTLSPIAGKSYILSVWCYKDSGTQPSGSNAIVDMGSVATDRTMYLKFGYYTVQNKMWSFWVRQSNGTIIQANMSGNTADISVWRHLVAVCDITTSTVYLYVDNVLKASTVWDGTYMVIDQINIGVVKSGGIVSEAFYDGRIDELYIANNITLANDGGVSRNAIVSSLYNSSVGKFVSQTVATDYRLSTTRRGIYNLTLTSGTLIATDCTNYERVQATLTLATNATLSNPTNLVTGGYYKWIITQDATGGRTLAYGTLFKFSGGIVPTITATANKTSIIQGFYDGTNIYCTSSLNY